MPTTGQIQKFLNSMGICRGQIIRVQHVDIPVKIASELARQVLFSEFVAWSLAVFNSERLMP
jgi:hypothetical protein